MRYRSELEKKYPDSFKKKIEAPNAGIQSALDSIDNAAYFESKYGWLDNQALGDISKNQMIEYIKNFEEEIKTHGITDPNQRREAAEDYIEGTKDAKVYILGNTFGDQVNRLLGMLTLSD